MLYGFLGPNGAGKTTTIRMALGLIFPTGGDVSVLDRPVFGSERDRAGALRRVGAMIEEPGFWRYLSGRTNLEYFAKAAGPAATGAPASAASTRSCAWWAWRPRRTRR